MRTLLRMINLTVGINGLKRSTLISVITSGCSSSGQLTDQMFLKNRQNFFSKRCVSSNQSLATFSTLLQIINMS